MDGLCSSTSLTTTSLSEVGSLFACPVNMGGMDDKSVFICNVSRDYNRNIVTWVVTATGREAEYK